MTMRDGSPDGPGSWTRTEYYGWEGFKAAHPSGEDAPESWVWGCQRCARAKAGEEAVPAMIALTLGSDDKVRGAR